MQCTTIHFYGNLWLLWQIFYNITKIISFYSSVYTSRYHKNVSRLYINLPQTIYTAVNILSIHLSFISRLYTTYTFNSYIAFHSKLRIYVRHLLTSKMLNEILRETSLASFPQQCNVYVRTRIYFCIHVICYFIISV